ncbi:hypothetical protein ACFOUY_00150 [Pedobacter jamesrossensis]|uniref:Lipoprotein n=1 Tax=Pedobacter jamesrossensis TaxID=1908238 RepID=A0ABV8NH86_9SPHI
MLLLLSCKPQKKYSKAPITANPIFYTENPAYTKLAQDLLTDFQFWKHQDEKIVLVDKPITFNNLSHFLRDSTSFTLFEIKYIIDQSEYLSRIKFQNNLGKKVKIIPIDSITFIFRNFEMNWKYFRQNYGESFIHLSSALGHPILEIK